MLKTAALSLVFDHLAECGVFWTQVTTKTEQVFLPDEREDEGSHPTVRPRLKHRFCRVDLANSFLEAVSGFSGDFRKEKPRGTRSLCLFTFQEIFRKKTKRANFNVDDRKDSKKL